MTLYALVKLAPPEGDAAIPEELITYALAVLPLAAGPAGSSEASLLSCVAGRLGVRGAPLFYQALKIATAVRVWDAQSATTFLGGYAKFSREKRQELPGALVDFLASSNGLSPAQLGQIAAALGSCELYPAVFERLAVLALGTPIGEYSPYTMSAMIKVMSASPLLHPLLSEASRESLCVGKTTMPFEPESLDVEH